MVHGTDRRRFLALGASAGTAAALAPLGAFAQPAPTPTPPGTCTPQACNVPTTATPVPWKRPADTVFALRRSAWDLSSAQLAKLRLAYQRMAALPPSDGRSLQGQRNLHAYYCVTCPGGPGFAGGDIHFSWNFLPWHRMFLYFHERILGSLVNDMSLRLTYWDWEVPSHALVPPAFGEIENNPLYDATRYLQLGQSVERMLTNYTTGKQRFYRLALVHRLLHCTWEDFGGTARGTDPDPPPAGGVVESGSHGFVHVSVGGDATRYDKLPCSGDMAILNTAARDPIFYAHHGNLDRLWRSWEHFGTNANPTDPAWRNLSWSFFDEHGTWTSMTVEQMADVEHALGYRYERPITPAPRLLRNASMSAMPERRIDLLAPPRANLLQSSAPASLAKAPAAELSVGGLAVPGEGDYELVVHSSHGTFSLGDIFVTPHGGHAMHENAPQFNVCQPLWGDYVSPPT
ncbi:MAG: tyrosinase family protein, partial [Candidatus Eremiobacteraeota bacterium]|nr:tyrosinase family protein [Candidatus Eremiobacteraeota bacterium]